MIDYSTATFCTSHSQSIADKGHSLFLIVIFIWRQNVSINGSSKKGIYFSSQ
jgi:hypothetical protein